MPIKVNKVLCYANIHIYSHNLIIVVDMFHGKIKCNVWRCDVDELGMHVYRIHELSVAGQLVAED